MLDKYIAKNSLLTHIGMILVIGCVIGGNIYLFVTGDKTWSFLFLSFALIGAILIMLGLIDG